MAKTIVQLQADLEKTVKEIAEQKKALGHKIGEKFVASEPSITGVKAYEEWYKKAKAAIKFKAEYDRQVKAKQAEKPKSETIQKVVKQEVAPVKPSVNNATPQGANVAKPASAQGANSALAQTETKPDINKLYGR